MNGKVYLKQQLPLFCLHIICMVALVLFLFANKTSIDSIILILLVWFSILFFYLWKSYLVRKRQLENLLKLTEMLDERYLISEIMTKPPRADDQVYYQILKLASKSMLEQIGNVQRERTEYKEYIEQWVHEIKTPITAMKLLCENNRTSLTKSLLVELEKTNSYTEQALYYSRSEHTEKDYSVREIRLFDIVHQAIAENKYLLLQYDVNIDVKETDETIYSDEKWLCFILNQLIVNAVKYHSNSPTLRFYTSLINGKIILCIEDNGIGIPASDLPRIFDKGFTGKNGRNVTQNSTGIGLYLCKRLCDKLGIEISATSAGSGAIFQLSFRINDFIHEVQG